MSEKNKTIELKEEELEKVSGGILFGAPPEYKTDPDGIFEIGEIVIDSSGVKYQILYFDEAGSDNDTRWYCALVIEVPDSAKCTTFATEGSMHFVNSSFVTHFG